MGALAVWPNICTTYKRTDLPDPNSNGKSAVARSFAATVDLVVALRYDENEL
jgi:hypothetical protein